MGWSVQIHSKCLSFNLFYHDNGTAVHKAKALVGLRQQLPSSCVSLWSGNL